MLTTSAAPAPESHDERSHSPSDPSDRGDMKDRYKVSRADLPLSCPMPGMPVWNSHPKVYLPIEGSGSAQCPYCGAHFTLEA
ncbi:zinc-finger domain-containing protein [Thioalkalivibrio sp. HK1]|uniref:zinc-finger domain-containing protein n=1 Tax=Thioalkalivibrio sp. HK1 TaxID=1469245 RepID=UPI00046FD989|nr:zinc-finger domain-containing protein [Thioalkalivibrio sp. HK1]